MTRTKSDLHEPTSAVLGELVSRLPGERLTLKWLIDELGERSFGVVLLLLGLLSLLPGIAAFVGVLLVVPGVQMMLAKREPIFARRIGSLNVSTARVVGLVRRASRVLRYLERFIRPRWPTPFEATKRAVGVVVLLLAVCIIVIPIPFSQVPPGLLVVLIAFAYLEEDGALLCIALLMAVVLLAALTVLVWKTVGLGLR